MERKSPGTYVLVVGLVLVVGGIALYFLPGPGWLLIVFGALVAAIGVALLLLERTAAKAAAMAPPDRPSGHER
jgi:hypothetical protein